MFVASLNNIILKLNKKKKLLPSKENDIQKQYRQKSVLMQKEVTQKKF